MITINNFRKLTIVIGSVDNVLLHNINTMNIIIAPEDWAITNQESYTGAYLDKHAEKSKDYNIVLFTKIRPTTINRLKYLIRQKQIYYGDVIVYYNRTGEIIEEISISEDGSTLLVKELEEGKNE